MAVTASNPSHTCPELNPQLSLVETIGAMSSRHGWRARMFGGCTEGGREGGREVWCSQHGVESMHVHLVIVPRKGTM